MATQPPDSPRYVGSPASAYIWAALWLLVATVATFALISEWSAAMSFEMKGQRTEGFLLFTPPLAFGAAILCIIIGARRAPKYREFLGQVRAEDRAALRRHELVGAPWRGPLALGLALSAVSVAGLVLLGILLVRGNSLGGVSVLLVVVMLFAMAGFTLLRTGIERQAVNRAVS